MEKILIIDDEKPTLSMFKLFLNAYGYEVLTAEDGPSGIELYKKESPKIVFTDVKMPEMDGIEVLSIIKKMKTPSEVIVITGHGDIDLAIKSLDIGATDYINKPINRKALDSALERAVARISEKNPESFELNVLESEKRFIIHITGSINSSLLLEKYKPAITELNNSEIEIAINKNFSINSDGIRGLIELIIELNKQSNSVTISGIPENFIPIFQMTGIFKALKMKP
jgi:YesN/AraC family two-component response regulator